MGKFFEDLKEGLEDIIAYQKGKKTLRTRFVELPEPPAQYSADAFRRTFSGGSIIQIAK